MFVDASALVAILFDEPERERFVDLCDQAPVFVVSPLVVWEASVALARASEKPIDTARERVSTLIATLSGQTATIDADDGLAALDAFARYGKGRHAARLNLADCFAYAMAKRRKLPLLYKGNDFGLTDIESALPG